VATIRALRHHGGAKKEAYNTPNLDFVEKGFENLEKHIENCKKFGLTPVVSINFFPNDSEQEISWVQKKCAEMGVSAVVSYGFSKGSDGNIELANTVIAMIESGQNNYKQLYDWSQPIEEKIKIIATEIYGAKEVEYSSKARTQLKTIKSLGYEHLPVCMAKTQKSLSDNEKLIGRPRNFSVTVREFEFAAGAGFIVPILGDIMRMPGLPVVPASEGMDIDADGNIFGLS
jgi:formate--tetrahydrofolate ligase